jgi:hypothetical protein
MPVLSLMVIFIFLLKKWGNSNVLWVGTNISEEYAASTFRVE